MRTTTYDWLHRHPLLVDVAMVVGLLLLLVTTAAGAGRTEIGLSVVLVVPLVVRRRLPAVSFGLVALGGALQLVVVSGPVAGDVAVLAALYALAAHERRNALRRAGLVVGIAAAVLAVADWMVTPSSTRREVAVSFLVLLFLVLVSWVLGDLMRSRRAVVSQLQEQNAALARERDQRVRLAAQEERSRIAREMHDVVAHSLSVIVVQADGGAYAVRHAGADPPAALSRAATTLDTVGGTARRALAETRRLVGVLREENQDLELAPQAGLDGLEALVEQVRASGLRVSHRVTGDAGDVPRDVSQAAYRVVQESLTNVLKHAGQAATAEVVLECGQRGVTLVVRDDGRGASAADDGAGHGLLGMSERVAIYGGRLEAGPRPAGGFTVHAHIPVKERVDD